MSSLIWLFFISIGNPVYVFAAAVPALLVLFIKAGCMDSPAASGAVRSRAAATGIRACLPLVCGPNHIVADGARVLNKLLSKLPFVF